MVVELTASMLSIIPLLLSTALVQGFYLHGNAILPSGFSSKLQNLSGKEAVLKQGKLHVTMFKNEQENESNESTYTWLDDDIVAKIGKESDEESEKEVGEKMITLPGGCKISEEEYDELEAFKKATDYVEKCYCEEESVYCELKTLTES